MKKEEIKVTGYEHRITPTKLDDTKITVAAENITAEVYITTGRHNNYSVSVYNNGNRVAYIFANEEREVYEVKKMIEHRYENWSREKGYVSTTYVSEKMKEYKGANKHFLAALANYGLTLDDIWTLSNAAIEAAIAISDEETVIDEICTADAIEASVEAMISNNTELEETATIKSFTVEGIPYLHNLDKNSGVTVIADDGSAGLYMALQDGEIPNKFSLSLGNGSTEKFYVSNGEVHYYNERYRNYCNGVYDCRNIKSSPYDELKFENKDFETVLVDLTVDDVWRMTNAAVEKLIYIRDYVKAQEDIPGVNYKLEQAKEWANTYCTDIQYYISKQIQAENALLDSYIEIEQFTAKIEQLNSSIKQLGTKIAETVTVTDNDTAAESDATGVEIDLTPNFDTVEVTEPVPFETQRFNATTNEAEITDDGSNEDDEETFIDAYDATIDDVEDDNDELVDEPAENNDAKKENVTYSIIAVEVPDNAKIDWRDVFTHKYGYPYTLNGERVHYNVIEEELTNALYSAGKTASRRLGNYVDRNHKLIIEENIKKIFLPEFCRYSAQGRDEVIVKLDYANDEVPYINDAVEELIIRRLCKLTEKEDKHKAIMKKVKAHDNQIHALMNCINGLMNTLSVEIDLTPNFDKVAVPVAFEAQRFNATSTETVEDDGSNDEPEETFIDAYDATIDDADDDDELIDEPDDDTIIANYTRKENTNKFEVGKTYKYMHDNGISKHVDFLKVVKRTKKTIWFADADPNFEHDEDDILFKCKVEDIEVRTSKYISMTCTAYLSAPSERINLSEGEWDFGTIYASDEVQENDLAPNFEAQRFNGFDEDGGNLVGNTTAQETEDADTKADEDGEMERLIAEVAELETQRAELERKIEEAERKIETAKDKVLEYGNTITAWAYALLKPFLNDDEHKPLIDYVSSDGGKYSTIYTDSDIYFDATKIGTFIISQYLSKIEKYSTVEQFKAAVTGLVDAIKRGDKEYKFPADK